jgi:hypothetical protein
MYGAAAVIAALPAGAAADHDAKTACAKAESLAAGVAVSVDSSDRRDLSAVAKSLQRSSVVGAKGLAKKLKESVKASKSRVKAAATAAASWCEATGIVKPVSPTTTTQAESPVASAGLVGLAASGPLSFPTGQRGQLTVVAQGPLDGERVPVVIRNNTKSAVTEVEVQGAARDANGTLVGSGSSQGVEPATITAGDLGIGYVYFEGGPVGASFTFTASAKPSKGSAADFHASAQITEHNLIIPLDPSDERQVVGSVLNPLPVALTGPIEVMVVCTDAHGTPTFEEDSFAEADTLPPGGTTTFSVGWYDHDCANYLVGASGYNAGAS